MAGITGKMVRKSNGQCAVCRGPFTRVINKWTGFEGWHGYRQSDMKTKERWVFCSLPCKEVWLMNPLGYSPSYTLP